jgi:hypothetical protein
MTPFAKMLMARRGKTRPAPAPPTVPNAPSKTVPALAGSRPAFHGPSQPSKAAAAAGVGAGSMFHAGSKKTRGGQRRRPTFAPTTY